jgi:protein O-GlcNAc transferase
MRGSRENPRQSTDLLLGRARESIEAGRLPQAFHDFSAAIDRDAACVDAWVGRGEVLLKQKEFAHAGAQFEQALRIDANHVAAHFQFAQVLFQFGLIEQALEHLDQITGRTNGQGELLGAIYAPGSASVSPAEILSRRRAYANSLPQGVPIEIDRRQRSPGPYRVGYVSAHFDRPNYMKPVWGLVNEHCRRTFELFFLSDAPEGPRGGYQNHPADHWLDVRRLDNLDLARKIRELQLDVLVDLNAYSYVRRLPLWCQRVAPVTIAWFNMYATSGFPGVDYLIGDRHVFLPHESDRFSEQVITLSHCYLTFRVFYETPDVAAPSLGASGALTIGCLAPMYKISDGVLDAWSEIMRRVPGTRLLLRNGTLDAPSNRQFVHARLQAAGLPMDRVEFRGSAGHLDFLRTYDDIHLALDTFPYNGGSTTMEALWQGVPVACFRGDRWAARISASLAVEAGLDDFVADSSQDHVERVVRLLGDPQAAERLAEHRRSIRSHLLSRSVCDTAGITREIETIYQRLVSKN